MSLSKIDHFNIVVSNLDRSVDFYTKVLDFSEIKRATLEGEWIDRIVGLKGVKAKVAYVRAQGGEPRIELLQYIEPLGRKVQENSQANTQGLRHFAIQIDNMDEMVDRLKANGIQTFSHPVTVPMGVVQHDDGEKSLCYFTDPDGVIIEFAQYK
jgi:catechol 2,3-dioxygenase-like lactoylglutathione lyase family enzyme